MRIYDWEAIERQHSQIQRLVAAEDYKGIVDEYRTIARSIGWSDETRVLGEADKSTLCFWMIATSIPTRYHPIIEDVFAKSNT